MRTPRLALSVALAFSALATSRCTCGKEKSDSNITVEPVTRVEERKPLDLEPLPEAPPVVVAPESLPGADGTLAVVTARPQGPMEGEVRPTVTFSKPVKSLADIESQREEDKAQPFATIEPKLEGEWRWLGSASAEFVPKGLVPYSTEFHVTVHKGLRAIDGSELKEDYRFTFSTPLPLLQDVSPHQGFTWMKPDDTVKLLFNQPVKDLAQHARFLVEGEAQPRPVTVVKAVSIAEERRAAEEKSGRRRYERMDFEARGFKNQQTRYELSAGAPLPLNRSITLQIDADLSGEQGPLTMGEAKRLEWHTYGPLRLTAVRMCTHEYPCPHGPLMILSTNQIDLESLKGRVKVTPKVELDWDHARADAPHAYDGSSDFSPYVSIPGNFKPGTAYTLHIDPGVKDVFGQTWAQPIDASDRTDDLEPALYTGGQNALIETATGTKVPLEVVNLRSLDVRLWNVSQVEAASLLAQSWYDQDNPIARPPDYEAHEELHYPPNETVIHRIDLAKVFKGSKTGMALVQVNSPDLRWRPRNGFRMLVQVTDLAVHFMLAPSKSLVWVTGLSDAKPVANAQVQIVDPDGQVRWSGTTNADGIADVPGAVKLGLSGDYAWDTPFAMATASINGDTGLSSSQWSDGLSPWDFNVQQGWEGELPQSLGFIFSERGIYRPGERVYFKGLARYRSVGALKAPAAGSKLTLAVTDSRGNDAKKLDVTVTKYGTFTATFDIPKDAPTGAWSVVASGNAPGGEIDFNGTFRVEEYRAPQFKVDVTSDKTDLVANDPLNATVYARYLFGGAMNNAKVRWSVSRTSTSFNPPGADSFTFAQETWWWDDNAPEDSSGFFASGEGAVDEKGTLAVEPGIVETPAQKTWTYTVEAEVEDVNRQVVANRTQVTVHPASWYVGMRGPVGFKKAGEEVPIDLIVTDVKGKRLGGKNVHVEVVCRSWKSVRQKDAGGGYTTVSEPVEEKIATCDVASNEREPVQCRFTAKASGFFIARATVADEAQRKHTASIGVYVTGPGFVAWQRNDTERIDLVPDKAKYDTGETARILIKSPYESARALVSVQREGVLDRKYVELKGSVTTVDIPITEEMVPNVFVSVLMVHPRSSDGIESGDDPGRPAVRVGLINLPVERAAKRLAVAVKADREEYRPGDEVTVNVAVKDRQGQPAPSEVTLFVVDEAVLRLTNYQTPDPIAAIFPDRALSVRLGEPLIHLVRKRDYGEKGEEAGGGGGGPESGEGAGFRSNFQTTVLFNPTLEIGADGTAQAKFKLPDNLTTFRIMAVAVTRGDRFGSGDTSIRVAKPLLALPALPRFARVGDRFEAGVVVHANGSGAGEVQVTAQTENAKLLGPAERRVQIAEGHPVEVRFPFTVERPGTATFRFRVQKGSDGDGVEVKIPVELPVAMEAVATYGDTKDQRVEGISPPKDVRDGMGGVEITLASTALGNFQEGFRQLVEYPYGCLEQQSSRLIPFVALRELAPKFGIPWEGPEKKQLAQERELNAFFRRYLFDPLDVSGEADPDQVIKKTIASIQSLQDEDGAFRYWADDWCPSSWASAYATFALSRAKDVGYPVEPQVLNRAQAYLTKVAAGQCRPCELSCPKETQVMAAWVLARSGRPEPSVYGGLFAGRKDLPLFSQALLSDAMFVGGGNRDQARTLLQEILNHAKESPRGVHFEETHGQTYATLWHSDTRTTGAVLQTLATLSPDHPYVSKIAHYLTGVREKGKWRSTQEAAFSLIGLTEMVRTKEKDTPDFVAKVLLGEQPLAVASFRGRSTAVEHVTVSMADLQKKTGGAERPLTFKKDGAGVLYYSALMRYAPTELPTKPLDAGLFVQRWFEPYSGGGQTTRFYAGDLVRVRVRVATNQERHWVAIEVPLPAGLEPVDTSLATTASLKRTPDEEGSGEGYDYESDEDQYAGSAYEDEDEWVDRWANTFWSPFNHVEQRDNRVVVFADHLPPGIHVASFVARATTPGTFLLKPATGQLMYEPEVFGRSEGGTFEVVLPQEVSQR
ncbi:MAG: alpha-2-macroglobulin [Myxococcaceae bacterium]|nr:alpha-2-macroglobulin [Myxococcaceae bacterium]